MQEVKAMPDEEPRSIATLESAERMLAEVATIDDVRALMDFAEQARVYARQSKLGTAAVNYATVIKVRAERRLAEIVDEGQRRGEIAQVGFKGSKASSSLSEEQPISLEALGIASGRMAEARLLRDAYSDADLETLRQSADTEDQVISRNGLIRKARSAAKANASPVVKLRDRKRKGIPTKRPEEVFICPQCGHRDERPAFRKEILKWRK